MREITLKASDDPGENRRRLMNASNAYDMLVLADGDWILPMSPPTDLGSASVFLSSGARLRAARPDQ